MRRFGSSLADNMRPESDASVGDPGATACLLTSGGDNRILVREDAANRYGCTPWPDPDLFGLGSATASTISEAGFAAADHVRRRALQGADTPADAYSREMDRVRAELLDLCRLSDVPGVDVVFGASGSDLHLYGTLLVDGAGPSPLLAVTVQSEETGRGVPKALGGRHFGDRAALGGAVTKGSRLTGAGMVEVAAVPVRDRDGQPREAEAVDSDIESLVAGAVKKGRQVLLTVTDTTKTGLTAPTPACAFALKQRWPESVNVFVDACQFRLTPGTVRDYLQRGFMVAVTGSKFLGGPIFSGALLVPGHLADRFARWSPPRGLHGYAARGDWPSGWRAAAASPAVANPGLLLRWEAALAELRRFRAIPDGTVRAFVDRFATVVAGRLAASSLLGPLPSRPGQRDAGDRSFGWDSMPTIFPFFVRSKPWGARGRTLAPEALGQIYRRMRADLRDASATRRHPAFAGLRVELGQPVACGERDGKPLAALRLCLGARLIVEAASGALAADGVIDKTMRALDKVEWLAARVD